MLDNCSAVVRKGVRTMRRCFPLAALTVMLVLALPGASQAARVVNGDFETGDFTGWTVVNQPDGFGNWYVYSGTVTPESGFPIAAPPQGRFAATTDMLGPGSHILYQDVRLREEARHTLSFTVYYDNLNVDFWTPASLDFTVFPNQQYRIDVMRRNAPVDSLAARDILMTVFQTQVGDAPTLAPTRVDVDLTCLADRKVRLRFAEVDNQFFFFASVDDVRIISERSKDEDEDDDDEDDGAHRARGGDDEACDDDDDDDDDDEHSAPVATSPGTETQRLQPYRR